VIRYPSVVTRDQDALTALLETHAPKEPRILDVTCNRRRIWKGLPYAVHGMDIDPEVEPDTVGNFCVPECWPVGRWEVVVFDPPHASEVGAKSRLRKPFSTAGTASVTGLFGPFLYVMEHGPHWGIETHGALLIVKLANQMHRNQQQWQTDEFTKQAAAFGWRKVDECIRTRKAQGNDPKWKNVHCLRKVHSTYLAYRRAA
jgi:hypothetical protein